MKDDKNINIRMLFSMDLKTVSIILDSTHPMLPEDIKAALEYYVDDAMKEALGEDLN